MAPPPTTTLSQSLLDAATAANARADNGQLIYGPVAALWDEYLQSEAVRKLPARFRGPLTALCTEIASVANRHFDAFIKGSHPPRTSTLANLAIPNPNTNTNTNTNPNPPANPRPASYAQAAATAPASAPAALRPVRKPFVRPVRPDTRLFVRIGPNHKARETGAFAVFLALKEKLGLQAPLLKEVQAVKTGFALCADSLEDLSALEEHSQHIAQLLGDCKIERQAYWTTYRLDNIPRTVRTHKGLAEVQSETLAELVLHATGQNATQIIETSQSKEQNLSNSSWFASFDTEAHIPLPRTLRILGVVAVSTAIQYKPKTIQCSRCYQWHNTRCCSRAQRCCICGSTAHPEEGHTTRCATARPHTCPPRCLHCRGPHPANDPKCPLRPTHKHNGPLSKAQQEAIRQSSKAARARACAAAKCSRGPRSPQDTQMAETAPTPTREGLESPDPSPTLTPTPTARPSKADGWKAGNRFAPLNLTDRLRAASSTH